MVKYFNQLNLSLLIIGCSYFCPIKAELTGHDLFKESLMENEEGSSLCLIDRRILSLENDPEHHISKHPLIKKKPLDKILNDGLLSIIHEDENQTFFIVDTYDECFDPSSENTLHQSLESNIRIIESMLEKRLKKRPQNGPPGVSGVTGASGANNIGVDGPTGSVGKTGLDGATGALGLSVINGLTGPTGATGFKGSTGMVGNIGSTGINNVTGFTGPTGVSGNIGLTGYIGATGATGATGAIGYILDLSLIGTSPNANGATLLGTTLNLEPASSLFGGVVTTLAQTIVGIKTFTNDIIGNGSFTLSLDSKQIFNGINRFLYSGASGSNTFLGVNSGALSATGNANTGVSQNSLASLTSADHNVAIGRLALSALSTGSSNTAVGFNTLNSPSNTSNNTSVGTESSSSVNSTATASSVFGYAAGLIITGPIEGTNVIAISPPIHDQSDSQIIQNAISIGQRKTTINIIAIGTNGTHISCNIQGIFSSVSSSGIALYSEGSVGQLGTNPSSQRFKNNMLPLTAEVSKKIYDMNAVSFYYKTDDQRIQFGMIAEEMDEILPELVVLDNDGDPYTIRYSIIDPLIIKELQDQEKQFNLLPEYEEYALGDIKFIKDGKTILLHIPSMSTPVILNDQNTFPESFIPNEPLEFFCSFMESGVQSFGFLKIDDKNILFNKLDGTEIKSEFYTKGMTITYIAK